jgi:hypothetical protein
MSARIRALALGAFAAALCSLSSTAAHAQASKAEMQAFPMPPASLVTTKTFAYDGDYGYYTSPASAVFNMSSSKAADYRYVRYKGVSGKDVWVYGAWGTTAIGQPSNGGDNCGHAHASYGVWSKYAIYVPGYGTLTGWVLSGGGGMSGTRATPSASCVLKVDNDLVSIDSRFGWGHSAEHLDYRNTTIYTDVVVGAEANTHGWGTCTPPAGQTFKACHEPAYIIGYTLP